MADKKQETGSQRMKNIVDAQQQQHLKDTAKVSTENNFGEIELTNNKTRKIFVGGLKEYITEYDLGLHFGQFGEIQYIDVKINYFTGRGRGFAFIVFKTMDGLNNALACTYHVINDNIVDTKKAVPQQVKLFVGGLTPYLTDDDIKDYFKHYAPLVAYYMPYDDVKNKRKSFCFITFDCMSAVNEILKSPRHVIMGKQVDVKKTKYRHNYDTINYLRSMSIMQRNFMDRRGRKGFPPQCGYAPDAPGYCYGNYYYNNKFIGYSPDYSHTYGFPCYAAGSRAADYQYVCFKPSAPFGGYENQIVV